MSLDRYFTGLDAERVDEHGFLDLNRSPRLYRWEALFAEPIAWVLGRPWLGKSTVAAALNAHLRTASTHLGDLGRRLTLTSLGSPDAASTCPPAWWDDWVTGREAPAVWLVDGVDEALDRNSHLLTLLADVVAQAPLAHLQSLRLVLFSRPYEELGELRESLQTKCAVILTRSRIPEF